MSKAVGVTCGIATQMLLDGFPPLNRPGVLAPYTKEICDPPASQSRVRGHQVGGKSRQGLELRDQPQLHVHGCLHCTPVMVLVSVTFLLAQFSCNIRACSAYHK